MKVSDLTPPALDYWVAKAEALHLSSEWNCVCGDGIFVGLGTDEDLMRVFAPSTKWEHAGPIIERDRPELMPCWPDGGWYARSRARPCDGDQVYGETALIAAMRARVISKFGFDVPDALDGEAGGGAP